MRTSVCLAVLAMACLSASNALGGVSLVNVNINLPSAYFSPQPSGMLSPTALLTYTETPTNMTMSIVGGDFDTDSSTSFGILGEYWVTTFSISQDSGYFNDVLSINGTCQHVVGPHSGDAPFGGIFTWNFVLDADNAAGGLVSANKSAPLGHPASHVDNFDAALAATVTSTAGFDDITGWTFTLAASHVPEPATLGIFALGYLALLRRRIR